MRATVRSELTKALTLRGFRLAGAAVLGLAVLVATVQMPGYTRDVAAIDQNGMIEVFRGDHVPARPMVTFLVGTGLFQTLVFFPVTGVVLAGAEYRAGQLTVSTLATPSPMRRMLGAAGALATVTVLVVALLAVVNTAFWYPAVKHWNPGVLTSGEVLLDYVFLALSIACLTVMAHALTHLTRSTVGGVAATVALLSLTMTQLVAHALPVADALLPYSAARNLMLRTVPGPGPGTTSGPDVAVLALFLDAVVAMALAGLAQARRDAR